MRLFIKNHGLLLAWIISVIAMFGSLYFSEVLKLPPCVLCWYQRICMYPLIVILGIGVWARDLKAGLYALILASIGLTISIYHNLLYYKVLSETIIPCSTGVSCTTKQLEWLGFITIPLLALTAFSLLVPLLIIYLKINQNES